VYKQAVIIKKLALAKMQIIQQELRKNFAELDQEKQEFLLKYKE